MDGYGGFEDQRIRHLEMIQAVISRLGTDSFLVKGWAVTVSAAFLGFAIDGESWGLALVGLLTALLFWGLDAYFLYAERRFRALHEAVRHGSPSVEPFFMAATQLDASETGTPPASWGGALLSPTLAGFYGTLAIAASVVAAIVCG